MPRALWCRRSRRGHRVAPASTHSMSQFFRRPQSRCRNWGVSPPTYLLSRRTESQSRTEQRGCTLRSTIRLLPRRSSSPCLIRASSPHRGSGLSGVQRNNSQLARFSMKCRSTSRTDCYPSQPAKTPVFHRCRNTSPCYQSIWKLHRWMCRDRRLKC